MNFEVKVYKLDRRYSEGRVQVDSFKAKYNSHHWLSDDLAAKYGRKGFKYDWEMRKV